MAHDPDVGEFDPAGDDRLYDLLAEWDQRRPVGPEPSPEELCPADPVLRERLRRKIAAQKRLEARLGLGRTDPAGARADVAGHPPRIAGFAVEEDIGPSANG